MSTTLYCYGLIIAAAAAVTHCIAVTVTARASLTLAHHTAHCYLYNSREYAREREAGGAKAARTDSSSRGAGAAATGGERATERAAERAPRTRAPLAANRQGPHALPGAADTTDKVYFTLQTMRAMLEALPQLLSAILQYYCNMHMLMDADTAHTNCALVAQGLIDAGEIDERLGDALSRLKEEDAISALDEYAVCDLSRVRSKGAYLMGLVKRYRTGQCAKPLWHARRKTLRRIALSLVRHNAAACTELSSSTVCCSRGDSSLVAWCMYITAVMSQRSRTSRSSFLFNMKCKYKLYSTSLPVTPKGCYNLDVSVLISLP
eukprot:19066-Heterococcus_DN1.PRE.2